MARPSTKHPAIQLQQKGLSCYDELCRTEASRLGAAGVRGHTINFVPSAWAKVVSLPVSVPRTGKISRGDVLDIGERVREGTSPATELLVWCLVISR